jgi:monothiol glutaredoxin
MTNYQEKIAKLNQENNIVLYMKGSKDFPQCGFSAMTCQILKNLDVDFVDINVLEDIDLRQAIKEYSDWPTIPQLYIKNEFIGGCDIVKEMSQSGELESLLKSKSLL